MTRHLAIGDIHGCITALQTLVDFVEPRPSDTIITLGDYIDRGPDSRAVLDFIINLDEMHQLIPLRGNHEIMMLDAREKKSWLASWLSYGGEATLQSYGGSFANVPYTHYDFLENRSGNSTAIITWVRLINDNNCGQARIIGRSKPHKRGVIFSAGIFPIDHFTRSPGLAGRLYAINPGPSSGSFSNNALKDFLNTIGCIDADDPVNNLWFKRSDDLILIILDVFYHKRPHIHPFICDR